jgi:hypothetical protein
MSRWCVSKPFKIEDPNAREEGEEEEIIEEDEDEVEVNGIA